MRIQLSTCKDREATFGPLRTGLLQRKCLPSGQRSATWGNCDTCEPGMNELKHQSVNQEDPAMVPSVVQDVLQTSGRPLEDHVRVPMESGFRHDFSRVRIHTNSRAAESARAVNALAYTVGQHVVFGPGQYLPQTSGGRKILAHELTHVIQQDFSGASVSDCEQPVSGHLLNNAAEQEADMVAASITDGRPPVIKQSFGRSTLSRQPASGPGQSGSQPASDIKAKDVFPFPKDSRVVLNRILQDLFFSIIKSEDPKTAGALLAIDRQVATVKTANDDIFEATLDGSMSIPAEGNRPARTLENITLRFQRQASGNFDFTVYALESGQGIILMERGGLSAERSAGGAITLSSGSGSNMQPELQVAEGGTDAVKISVFTAPFLNEIPEAMRSLVPETVEAISITQLPSAATAPEEIESAVERIAERTGSERRIRRQQVGFGLGVQFGAEDDIAPLLSTSWQIRFPTTGILGAFGIPESTSVAVGESVFVPMEVRLQYAPTLPEFEHSVLGSVTSGIGFSLSAIDIPVNLVVLTGLAGGGVPIPTETGREFGGAFGIPLGIETGLELKNFRVNLRYEHLFNLLSNSPDIDSLFVNIGPRF